MTTRPRCNPRDGAEALCRAHQQFHILLRRRLVRTPDAKFYPAELLATLPEGEAAVSYGCGDPITLAALIPGQTVLDLGSGAGLDCFFAAQEGGRDGPSHRRRHDAGDDRARAGERRTDEAAERGVSTGLHGRTPG